MAAGRLALSALVPFAALPSPSERRILTGTEGSERTTLERWTLNSEYRRYYFTASKRRGFP